MVESPSYSQVLLAALVALAPISGAVAGAPATTHESSDENVSATVVHEGEQLELRPAEGQTVTVRTNAPAGTEVTVVLRENGNFEDVYAATVSEDRTATASLDLRTAEPGTDLSITVRYEQEDLAKADVAVVNESVEDPTVTTTTRPTTYDESGFPFTTTTATTDTPVRTSTIATDSTTATATATGPSGDDSPDGPVGEFGVPGFDAFAALLALLTALALARRRRT